MLDTDPFEWFAVRVAPGFRILNFGMSAGGGGGGGAGGGGPDAVIPDPGEGIVSTKEFDNWESYISLIWLSSGWTFPIILSKSLADSVSLKAWQMFDASNKSP